MVGRAGGDVRMMLTWFIFFMPLSLPSSFLFTSRTNNRPVLEYRDKLFTHSNQKPASKERIQHQGRVTLSPSPASAHYLSNASSMPPSFLSNRHKSSLTRSLHRASNPVRRSSNHVWLCEGSSGSCGFSQDKVAALMWPVHCYCVGGAELTNWWLVTSRARLTGRGCRWSWQTSHEALSLWSTEDRLQRSVIWPKANSSRLIFS